MLRARRVCVSLLVVAALFSPLPSSTSSSRRIAGLVVSAASTSDHAVLEPLPWMQCIDNIHAYFRPESKTSYRWKLDPDGCGFRTLSYEDIRKEALFHLPLSSSSPASKSESGNKTLTTFSFSGDSTGIRAFIFAWNELLEPNPKMTFQKVAKAPQYMQAKMTAPVELPQSGSGTTGGGAAENGESDPRASSKDPVPVTAQLRYYKLMFLSTAPATLKEAILSSKGRGCLVLVLGNWDLNWKIQLNQPMPGLVGGSNNYTAAKVYWTTYVEKTLTTISEALRSMPEQDRPFVMIREQMLPNCNAARFSGKKRQYRKCAPFVRPEVVPLYRRVVSAMAWSLGIPTIPMDPLFNEDGKFCALGDGLHLDTPCHHYEQQLIWNTYLLMLRRVKAASSDGPDGNQVRQGYWQPGMEVFSKSNGNVFPVGRYTDPEAFDVWRAKFTRKAPGGVDAGTLLKAHGPVPKIGAHRHDVETESHREDVNKEPKATKHLEKSRATSAATAENDNDAKHEETPRPQAKVPTLTLSPVLIETTGSTIRFGGSGEGFGATLALFFAGRLWWILFFVLFTLVVATSVCWRWSRPKSAARPPAALAEVTS